MSKTNLLTHSKNVPSVLGLNSNRPSGAASIATSDNPEALAFAIRYGNRPTRRLAKKKLASSRHRKLMNQIGDDL